MDNKNSEKIEGISKSHQRQWDELSPDERRTSIIRMRNARTKNGKKSVVVLIIGGLSFLAIAIYFWYCQYNMSLQSSLGIVAGIILAALGFKVVLANKVISYRKLFSNDFSDDDINAYFQEEAKINQRFLKQWNKTGKYVVFIGGSIIMLLIINKPTAEFGFMALWAGITTFILGVAVLSLSKPVERLEDHNATKWKNRPPK